MSDDPYRSLADLARGWENQANDIAKRAAAQRRRAEQVTSAEARFNDLTTPQQWLETAAMNDHVATTLSMCAKSLEDGIEFARRHVLGDPS